MKPFIWCRETPQDQQKNVRMVIYSDRNTDRRRYILLTVLIDWILTWK